MCTHDKLWLITVFGNKNGFIKQKRINCPRQSQASVNNVLSANFPNLHNQLYLFSSVLWCKFDKFYRIRIWHHVTCTGYDIMWPVHYITSCDLYRIWHHVTCKEYGIMWPVQDMTSCDLYMIRHHVTCTGYDIMWPVKDMTSCDLYRIYHVTCTGYDIM